MIGLARRIECQDGNDREMTALLRCCRLVANNRVDERGRAGLFMHPNTMERWWLRVCLIWHVLDLRTWIVQ